MGARRRTGIDSRANPERRLQRRLRGGARVVLPVGEDEDAQIGVRRGGEERREHLRRVNDRPENCGLAALAHAVDVLLEEVEAARRLQQHVDRLVELEQRQLVRAVLEAGGARVDAVAEGVLSTDRGPERVSIRLSHLSHSSASRGFEPQICIRTSA